MRAAALMLLTIVACATAPSRNVQIARQVHYDAGIDVIEQVVLDVVGARAKRIERMSAEHRVRTAWEIAMREQREGTTPRGRPPSAVVLVQYDVAVVGQRPYEVRVIVRAARWEPGMAAAVALHGADEPAWLATRADDIRVAIYDRLQTYAR